MAYRIAINGFGRMGRLAFRVLADDPTLEVVAVNDPGCDAATSAHLVHFDSLHGRFAHELSATADALWLHKRKIRYSSEKQLERLPFKDEAVDLVLECSGKFRSLESCQPYLDLGIAKVIVSSPLKGEGLNIVMGVNDHLYEPQQHAIVSAASCTTNSLAPVVKVLQERFGIKHGSITTIHNLTNSQSILDQGHKDLRRARACQLSLIPTSTGSATAITSIFPELKGKLNGLAVRVPVLNASITDAVFELKQPITVEQANAAFKEAANGPLAGILGYEERPLVSVDYLSNPHSGTVDGLSTMVIDGTQLKVLIFYDNEMGYVHRMCELAKKISLLGG